LAKGSKLMGHVTDVQAKTKDNHNSYVGFAFDHALLKDGRQVPVQATMRSMSAPASVSAASNTDDTMSGGMQGGGARGGSPGLAGAAPGSARGATSATRAAGGTTPRPVRDGRVRG